MRYKYYYFEKCVPQLVEFLEREKVDYTKSDYRFSDNQKGQTWIKFTIWSTAKNVEMYLMELAQMGCKDPIVSVEYTSVEYEKAKLLMMTPRKQSIDIENYDESFRYQCSWIDRWGESRHKHEEPIGILKVRKEPSMKTQTAFWCESTGFAEIFADYRVAKLVKDNFLKGIELKRVMIANDKYSEILYQMTSQNILGGECIRLGYGEKMEKCHICGKEQYFTDNVYQLHLDFSKIKEESDLYVTERIWGQGIAYPIYIISQKFYQLLKKNKLAGNLTFSPVVDTSKI